MSEPAFKDDHEDTFDFLAQYLSPKHSNTQNTAPSNHQQSRDTNNKDINITDAKLIHGANTTSDNAISPNIPASNITPTPINPYPTSIIATGTSHSPTVAGDSNQDASINAHSNGKESQSDPSISIGYISASNNPQLHNNNKYNTSSSSTIVQLPIALPVPANLTTNQTQLPFLQTLPTQPHQYNIPVHSQTPFAQGGAPPHQYLSQSQHQTQVPPQPQAQFPATPKSLNPHAPHSSQSHSQLHSLAQPQILPPVSSAASPISTSASTSTTTISPSSSSSSSISPTPSSVSSPPPSSLPYGFLPQNTSPHIPAGAQGFAQPGYPILSTFSGAGGSLTKRGLGGSDLPQDGRLDIPKRSKTETTERSMAFHPDYRSPFTDIQDVHFRLACYHVFNAKLEPEEGEKDQLLKQAQSLMSQLDMLHQQIQTAAVAWSDGGLYREDLAVLERLAFYDEKTETDALKHQYNTAQVALQARQRPTPGAPGAVPSPNTFSSPLPYSPTYPPSQFPSSSSPSVPVGAGAGGGGQHLPVSATTATGSEGDAAGGGTKEAGAGADIEGDLEADLEVDLDSGDGEDDGDLESELELAADLEADLAAMRSGVKPINSNINANLGSNGLVGVPVPVLKASGDNGDDVCDNGNTSTRGSVLHHTPPEQHSQQTLSQVEDDDEGDDNNSSSSSSSSSSKEQGSLLIPPDHHAQEQLLHDQLLPEQLLASSNGGDEQLLPELPFPEQLAFRVLTQSHALQQTHTPTSQPSPNIHLSPNRAQRPEQPLELPIHELSQTHPSINFPKYSFKDTQSTSDTLTTQAEQPPHEQPPDQPPDPPPEQPPEQPPEFMHTSSPIMQSTQLKPPSSSSSSSSPTTHTTHTTHSTHSEPHPHPPHEVNLPSSTHTSPFPTVFSSTLYSDDSETNR